MKPGEAAFLAFVLAFLVGAGLWEWLDEPNLPLHCKDYWDSASIGAQGACSHHGGVTGGEDLTPWWKRALAITGGMLSFVGFTALLQRFPQPKPDRFAPFKDPVSLLIQDAMKQGKDVSFTYRKEQGEPETRRITPLDLTMLRSGALNSRCLVGYCHCRSAKRAFALMRISDLKLINPVR